MSLRNKFEQSCLNPLTEDAQKDKRNKEGTFFSFGDSISNAFLNSLSSGPFKSLCKTVFTSCRPIYHWVYDMRGYWGDGVTSPMEPIPDGIDYNHDRVLRDIKMVSTRRLIKAPALSFLLMYPFLLGFYFMLNKNFVAWIFGAKNCQVCWYSNYNLGWSLARTFWKGARFHFEESEAKNLHSH